MVVFKRSQQRASQSQRRQARIAAQGQLDSGRHPIAKGNAFHHRRGAVQVLYPDRLLLRLYVSHHGTDGDSG